MDKTDWRRTLDKDWIGCYILPDSGKPDTGDRSKKETPSNNPYRTLSVTLISVKQQSVKVAGRESKNKVAHFAKNPYFDKPMLMNQSTNLKRLQKLTGSRFMEDYEKLNLSVTLQAEWDKHPQGGYEWALRIADKSPEKPELKEGTVDWTACMKYVVSGGDPSGLRATRKISDELFKKLEDARGNATTASPAKS